MQHMRTAIHIDGNQAAATNAQHVVRQSVGQMQDIQVNRKYRKADLADSDFLEKQGSTYFNHGIRSYCHNNPSLIHLFPEPSMVQAQDQD